MLMVCTSSGSHLNTFPSYETIPSRWIPSKPAFGGEGVVSLGVSAVVVDEVTGLDPPHGPILLPGQTAGPERGSRHRAAPGGCVSRAATRFEVRVSGHERLVPVIGLVLTVFRGPRRCIPYGSVEPHRPQGKCRVALSRIPPYRHIIHEESEQIRSFNTNQTRGHTNTNKHSWKRHRITIPPIMKATISYIFFFKFLV